MTVVLLSDKHAGQILISDLLEGREVVILVVVNLEVRAEMQLTKLTYASASIPASWSRPLIKLNVSGQWRDLNVC